MQRIEIFQIDAFTDKVFHGNPAAICLLKVWLNDELMQAIAVENNLSETAFVMEDKQGFHIRWFAPNGEIDLCGHATLAAGFLLFESGRNHAEQVSFSSASGQLLVRKIADRITLDFPSFAVYPLHSVPHLRDIVDQPILDVYDSDLDYLVLLANETSVLNAQVNLDRLVKLPRRGLILTASSNDADYYSRCFYPKHNIAEDPVTGSAQCVLAPYWAKRLSKKKLTSIQGSFRKGHVFCDVMDGRVHISGHCRWYSKGFLMI